MGLGKFHVLSPKKSLSFSLVNHNAEKTSYKKDLSIRMIQEEFSKKDFVVMPKRTGCKYKSWIFESISRFLSCYVEQQKILAVEDKMGKWHVSGGWEKGSAPGT